MKVFDEYADKPACIARTCERIRHQINRGEMAFAFGLRYHEDGKLIAADEAEALHPKPSDMLRFPIYRWIFSVATELIHLPGAGGRMSRLIKPMAA